MAAINGGGSAGGYIDPYTVGAGGRNALAAAATRDNRASSNSAGSTSSSSNTNSNQTQNSSQTQNVNQKTNNMSSANQATLQKLIQQLLAGGTEEMRQQSAARAAETQQVQAMRGQYSKEAAFNDAQGLISQQMRRTLESLLPSINRAAEDAGSSGGALRALLLQDAANKAAESSSALGVQTAVNYGNIGSNLSQVLERLTASDPTVTNALLGALGVAKGAVQNTTGTTTTNGTTTTAGSQQQQQSGNSSESKNVNTDYAPFDVSTPTGSSGPIYFGPSAPETDPSKFIGTTIDTLAQLSGQGNPWQSYSSF